MRLDTLLQSFSTFQKLLSPKMTGLSAKLEQLSSSKTTAQDLSSVIVNLSAQGSMQSRYEGKDKDVLNSELPDTIKQNLLQIRAIKRLIAEKEAELAQLKRTSSKSEQGQAQTSALNTQLMGLNESLGSAMQQMAKSMQKLKLDKTQALQTMQLALKSVKNL